MTHTQVEFRAWFDNLFAQHDADGSGDFDKAEAGAFARALHALKNDGTEFDVERAKALWDAHAVDERLPKESVYEKLLARAKDAGKISDWNRLNP